MNTSDWNIIDVYSRKQAIADGIQVLANPQTTKEAGIKFPVYFTKTAYEKYVKVPEGMDGYQDEIGRLWDILMMFRYKARGTESNQITFEVSVSLPNRGDWTRNEKRKPDAGPDQRLVTLFSEIGPFDFDDPSPAITIMIPGED